MGRYLLIKCQNSSKLNEVPLRENQGTPKRRISTYIFLFLFKRKFNLCWMLTQIYHFLICKLSRAIYQSYISLHTKVVCLACSGGDFTTIAYACLGWNIDIRHFQPSWVIDQLLFKLLRIPQLVLMRASA